MTEDARGGVVFRVDGAAWFLPASIAKKIIAAPAVGRVPGAPAELRGVALVDGDVIPVVELRRGPDPWTERAGPRSGEAMLVCTVLGESVGLVGIDVVATGRFDAGASAGEVRADGETARLFDVAAVIARVRESRWAV